MKSKSSSCNTMGAGSQEVMFSQRIVNLDFYSTFPSQEFDPVFSEFGQVEIPRVPVIRIFGSTPRGQKTCTHLHGVFPYISVLDDNSIPNIEKEFAESMDNALNEYFKRNLQNNIDFNKSSVGRHVFSVVKISGRTFYGYRHTEETFLRIYFYNPYVIKKAVELLLLGTVLDRKFQPYEAHIPYHLQFMIDHNLYGMNLIHFNSVKFRRSQAHTTEHVTLTTSNRRSSAMTLSGAKTVWDLSSIRDNQFSHLKKTTRCDLEIDVLVEDIVNSSQSKAYSSNPGIEAIWQDEMERRRQIDPQSLSQISIPSSQARTNIGELFDAEMNYQQILDDKIAQKSSVDSFPEFGNVDAQQGHIQSSQIQFHYFRTPVEQSLSGCSRSKDIENEMELFESFIEETENESLDNAVNQSVLNAFEPLWEQEEEHIKEENDEEDSIHQDHWEQSYLEDSMIKDLIQPDDDDLIPNFPSSSSSDSKRHSPHLQSKSNVIFQGDGQGDDSESDETDNNAVIPNVPASKRRSTRISKRDEEGKVTSYAAVRKKRRNKNAEINPSCLSDTQNEQINEQKQPGFALGLSMNVPPKETQQYDIFESNTLTVTPAENKVHRTVETLSSNHHDILIHDSSDMQGLNVTPKIVNPTASNRLSMSIRRKQRYYQIQNESRIIGNDSPIECSDIISSVFLNDSGNTDFESLATTSKKSKVIANNIIRSTTPQKTAPLPVATHHLVTPKKKCVPAANTPGRKAIDDIFNANVDTDTLKRIKSERTKKLSTSQVSVAVKPTTPQNSFISVPISPETPITALKITPPKLIYAPSGKLDPASDIKLNSPPYVRIQSCPVTELLSKQIAEQSNFEKIPNLLLQKASKTPKTKPKQKIVESIDKDEKIIPVELNKKTDSNTSATATHKKSKHFIGPRSRANKKRRAKSDKIHDIRSQITLNVAETEEKYLDANKPKVDYISVGDSHEIGEKLSLCSEFPFLAHDTATTVKSASVVNFEVNVLQHISSSPNVETSAGVELAFGVDSVRKNKYRSIAVQTELEENLLPLSGCTMCSNCGSGVTKQDQSTDVRDFEVFLEGMDHLESNESVVGITNNDPINFKLHSQEDSSSVERNVNPEKLEKLNYTSEQLSSNSSDKVTTSSRKKHSEYYPATEITDSPLLAAELTTHSSKSISPNTSKHALSIRSPKSKNIEDEEIFSVHLEEVENCTLNENKTCLKSPRQEINKQSRKIVRIRSPRRSPSKSPMKKSPRKRFFFVTSNDESFSSEAGKSTEAYKKLFKKMLRRNQRTSSNSITVSSLLPKDKDIKKRIDLSVASFYDFDSTFDYGSEIQEDEADGFGNADEDPATPEGNVSFFQVKRSVSRNTSRKRRMKIQATKLRANFLARDVFDDEFEPLKRPPSYKWAVKFSGIRKKSLLKGNRSKKSVEENGSGLSSQESTPEKIKGNLGNYSDEDDDESSGNVTSISPDFNTTECKIPSTLQRLENRFNDSYSETPKSILRGISLAKSARQRCATGKRKIRWDDASDANQPLKRIKLMSKFVTTGLPITSPNMSSLDKSTMNLSELDGISPKNCYGFEHDMSNLHDAKALHQHQYITIMSLEVHCETRGNLLPDPAHDKIVGIFIYISNDYPDIYHKPQQVTKCLILSPEYSQNVPNSNYEYFQNELQLFKGFLKFFHEWDPDMLIGYEIEKFSWGYIIGRGFYLDINMITELSRMLPYAKKNSNTTVDNKKVSAWDSQIRGRIVLNLWRLLRHEITVQSYTYENSAYHVLHRRVCRFTYETLWEFWNQATNRWRVLEYYSERAKGCIEIIQTLDMVNRTSELARLFGILFYEVFSRGSQFRVESMMLRISKTQNFVAVSPGIRQRASMKAPEFVPLILEPISNYYTDPVAVLDFQSLYPSMMIAYNYDYSTVIGRVEHLAQDEFFKLGCIESEASSYVLNQIRDHIHISPCGVAFVKPEIRKGILPEMLEQILETRQMVKRSMKKWKSEGATLQKILDSRQLGLKLIANVSYGYTSANFSGRMPCVEIADSIVSKGRETLQRAIDMVKSNYHRWGGDVVYGDTDSMFIVFRGKSRPEAFKIAHQIAEEVTQANPKPVKLKFEKIYQPCILQSKKRYVGYSYETVEQENPIYDAKGIETVRRDGCPAVKKILEKTLHILFTTNNPNKVKNFVQLQFKKLFTGRVSMKEYTFAREFRGRDGYKPGACVPSLEIAKKLTEKDPRAEPLNKERVPYVIIYDKPTLPLIQMVRTPNQFANDYTLRLNAHYYIEKAIIPALNRCLALAKINVASWYKGLPRKYLRNILQENAFAQGQGTLDDYLQHVNCFRCDRKTDKGSCPICDKPEQIQRTTLFLVQHSSSLASKLEVSCQICEICSGDDGNCTNVDCPVFHKILRYERDEHYNRQLLSKLRNFEL